MSPEINRQWLHDWAMVCRTLTLTEFTNVNTCILSTRIGLDVLHHYGLTARAQPVRVLAANEPAMGLILKKVPHSQWPDDAWSVGIEGTGVSDTNMHQWDGHLVILLRNPSRRRTLIDLTADQLDRPARNINIGGPVFMDLAPVWAPGDMLYTEIGQAPHRTIVGYEPQVNAGAWQTAPDWMDHAKTHQAMVDTLIQVLDTKYPNGPQEV